MTTFPILSLFAAAALPYAFEPGVDPIPEGTASRSKIIWAADGVATNGIVSYYRQVFSLAEKPVEAKLETFLDDSGTVFVNGARLARTADVTAHLVAGTNTLGVQLFNAYSSSGAMYLLTCADAAGRKTYLHSDAAVRGTVKPQEPGWEQPGFDDSSWPQVTVCGDVLGKPWSLYRDLRRPFTTPEEYARLMAADAASKSLPPGLAAEPEPVARVVYQGHVPKIEINGTLHEAAVNICDAGDPYRDSGLIRCARAGFEIVELKSGAEAAYRGDDRPCDFSFLDDEVRRILHRVPDTYLILGLRFGMSKWAKAHPEEQMGYGTGPADPRAVDDLKGRPIRPSAASDAFRALTRRILGDYAAYIRSKPWAKRVIGIRLMNGIYGEWHPYGMYEAPDTGPCMQAKFRAYMQAKRGVADAEIPSVAMRRRGGDLLDPSEDQLVLDYYDCHAHVMADLLLDLAHEARTLFPGRLIGAYYGYLFTGHPPEGTNSLLEKVLASPDIDFLSNPPYYSKYARLAGGSYAPRTIPSAFRRYGKLSLLEDDSRFHHVYDWIRNSGQGYATQTPQETEMNMRRNWLNQFFDGDGIQLFDPMEAVGQRPYAFDDPSVFKAITESRAALEKAGEPADESGNRVAVVMSPREVLRQDGDTSRPFTAFLYRQTFLDLHRSGTAFDLLALEDYLAKPSVYQTVLFLNAFYLSAAERAELVKRTRAPGTTAIWIGPAGGVTDAGFDDAAMSDLTGISATGAARRPHVVCTDSEAQPLYGGKFYMKRLPGHARSVLVPEPLRAPRDYANLLVAAGAWRYVAPGGYFRRHGDVLMYHTGSPGGHVLRLPEKGLKVRELFTGAMYDSSELRLETEGPRTWLFRIERSK